MRQICYMLGRFVTCWADLLHVGRFVRQICYMSADLLHGRYPVAAEFRHVKKMAREEGMLVVKKFLSPIMTDLKVFGTVV